ncbi:MAG: S8 family serine peptidase [Sedimentisphaerales bacterium]|nr:S8 family serine peptidase [Sedimentisphaerales bacterium]
MVLTALSVHGAQEDAVRGRYVPGEIIVKLRADTADGAGTVLERDRFRLVSGLGESQVREVKPLARGLRIRSQARGETGATSSQRRWRRRQPKLQMSDGEREIGRLYRVRTDAQSDSDTEQMLAALRRLPDVEYAERNSIVSACTVPNDPLYGSQWALAKIDAAGAWELCRGLSDIVVAVPDTGVDYSHRDLQGNLWTNDVELNGIAGMDDDGNGYIDDARGYDFMAPDNDPSDDSGHGTHCAGIVAARGNNALDMAGICWTARIMPIKMLDDEGLGTASEAVEAIYYAVANGADVISCSWGDPEDSQAVREAVAYAYSEGVVVVASAGNERSDMRFYPAAYSEVIGVAATDRNDRRQYASSFGDWVDIAAPGDDILSLRAAGTSAGAAWDAFATRLSGTSMAAPHVSGACALLLSANPFLGPDELRQRLLATGDPIDTGISASNTRLNIAGALGAAVPLKGAVGFDRLAYAEGSDILIHLADRHLRGTARQTVLVTTDGGDVEAVVLAETSLLLGVFSAVLSNESGAALPGDGRVQALDGQWITAEYLDADTGEGSVDQTVTSRARADYEAPVALNAEIEPRGTSAWVTIVTSEPAQVRVRYGRTGDNVAWISVRDPAFKGRHRLCLGPLLREQDYGLTITLTDAAGNETAVDTDSLGQAFSLRVDPATLLVPDMYRTIQDAVDAAQPGQTIWVADGTYSGSGNRAIDFEGKAIALRSENGPQACVVSLRRRNYAFIFRNGEGASTVLDGFTISNGGRTDFGGAIQCLSSAPTIVNCVLTENSADRYGGAIYCSMSSPTIEACTFVGNLAEERGGGLYCDSGSSPVVTRCTFTDNWARSGGAVAGAAEGHPVLRQCLFYDNAAESYGGAFAGFASAAMLTNCTIALNQAGQAGGGLWGEAVGSCRLKNCILWDNTVSVGAASIEAMQIAVGAAALEVDYSCVRGWTGTLAGVGSFDLDPLFADPENGDFHLRSQGGRWDGEQWLYDGVTSPCIDAGDPAWPLGDELPAAPNDPTNTQTSNTRINLGAYGGTSEASLAPRQ